VQKGYHWLSFDFHLGCLWTAFFCACLSSSVELVDLCYQKGVELKKNLFGAAVFVVFAARLATIFLASSK